MKCNKGTELVCYYYDKCKLAHRCRNVTKGIREKLKREKEIEEQTRKSKRI